MPNWKKVIISGSDATLNSLSLSSISAGTSDYNKFLVSDNGEIKFRTGPQIISDIGGVDTSGTPLNNQLAIFTDANTIEGTTALTYNGTTLSLNPGFVDNSIISGNTSGITRIFGTSEVQLESDLEINIGDSSFTYITVSPNEGVIKFPQLGNGFVKQTGGELTIDSSTYSTQTLTLGTSGQVPFMNGTTDFSYSSGLRFSSNQLLFAQNDAGIDASTSSKIKFGDINGDDITVEIVGFGGDASSNGIILSEEEIAINSTDISILGDVSVQGNIGAQGGISATTIPAATTDTDKFLVLDTGGVFKYRTGTQVKSDIGAVSLSGNETIAGIKTFSSFPVTPSSAPTLNYQTANKKYVDDSVSAGGGGTVTEVDATGTVNGITLTTSPAAGITSTGTVTLGGTLANIANTALTNSTVSYGGVQLSLGGIDATPAFNLSDATSYPGDSSLVTLGTITTGTWNGTAITMPYLNFGGTSTQFVKGDGTLDSNTYLTTTGNGSGLTNVDAETLDSLNSTDFLRSNLADSFSVKYSGNGSSQIWMDNDTDVGLTTTGHAFQIGASSGINIRMDNNEILCVNNGAADSLRLQRDGGNVFMFGATPGVLDVNGNILASSFKTDGGTSTQFVKGDGTLDSSTYSTQTLTLGQNQQVPFMNGTTDFDYSSALIFKENSISGIPVLEIAGQASANLSLTGLNTQFVISGGTRYFTLSDESLGESFFRFDSNTFETVIGDFGGFQNQVYLQIDDTNTTIAIKNSSLDIDTIANATTDTDKFLVSDSGTVKYRTGNEVRGDIGALKLVKALSVETIGASENILLWYTTEAIDIESIEVAISQSGLLPTPSVDFNIKSGANRNSLTVSAFTSDQTATGAAGASYTPNTSNIAANRWIALTTSAATALTNLDISITCIPQ
jgi:hypothetical protein